VDDTLDLSRLDAGRLVLEFTDFDLSELVMSVARSQASQAQRKNLSLELRVAETVPLKVTHLSSLFSLPSVHRLLLPSSIAGNASHTCVVLCCVVLFCVEKRRDLIHGVCTKSFRICFPIR